MRLPFFWLILLVSVLLWGCYGLVEDLGNDKIPNIESKLVVSCYISPQSSIIRVIVSESQPLLGPATYNPVFIPNAEVILSSESDQVRLPFQDSIQQYYIDSSAFKIVAGQTYTLSVNDGKRFVKATCTVPRNAPINGNMIIENIPSDAVGYSSLRIRASWKDIVGEKNYYTTRGYIAQEIIVLRMDPRSGDAKPVPEKYRNELVFYPSINNLFNDSNLDGTTFAGALTTIGYLRRDTIVYRDKNNQEHSFDNRSRIKEIHLEVMNIDEHYYQFLRSTANYKEDNKFTEPTPVYTNIQGGLGCFGAFNAAVLVDTSGW